MPQFSVDFHPLAANEAQAAERWYRERNEVHERANPRRGE